MSALSGRSKQRKRTTARPGPSRAAPSQLMAEPCPYGRVWLRIDWAAVRRMAVLSGSRQTEPSALRSPYSPWPWPWTQNAARWLPTTPSVAFQHKNVRITDWPPRAISLDPIEANIHAIKGRKRRVASYAIKGVQILNPTKQWVRKHAKYEAEFEQRQTAMPEVFSCR